jgi:glycosyltransferase involved in cell wall biosynthesis
MMLLSLLIPTLSSRAEQCLSLVDKLLDQVEHGNYIGLVEVVTLYDNGEKSIGTKRNELIQMAKGKYVAFIDDDDSISSDYIDLLIEGISKDVDCCSLRGVITWDGENPEIFEHSVSYNEWKTNITGVSIKYERFINHLNCVKKSIANNIKYAEISHGEDRQWSEDLMKSGLVKTEHYIPSVIYHYIFKTNK